MFDTSLIWASVLKALRENKEAMLHAACSDIDVEYTNDFIILTPPNETIYSIISKRISTLNGYAKTEVIKINKPIKQKNISQNIEKLKEVIGSNLIIEYN